MTIYETWEAFKEERSISLCATTLSSDYAQVTKWLKRCPIQELSQGRQALIWILKQQPIQSARRVCMFLRAMYTWACSEDVGILNKNPVINFKMPKAPQSNREIVVIPKSELNLIIAALKNKESHKEVRWDLYAEFMLQTGMRTGEVRALKWADIDGSKLLVHSNYTLTHGYKNSTKTNKQRWVPINARVQEILDELETVDEYVFPYNRNAFQDYFRSRVVKLHQDGLIKRRYRPYDLRHVAISKWLEAGIPVTQVASWAGNTSEVIWKHYANTTESYEMPVL